jgi:hypothetical protein
MIVEHQPTTQIDQVFNEISRGYSVANKKKHYPLTCLENKSQHVDYNEFGREVEDWNVYRLTNLIMTLEKALSGIPKDKVSIIVVGSDARREKGPSSPFEFCILAESEDVAKYVLSVLSKKIKSANDLRIGLPNVTFDPEVEVKLLSKNDPNYKVSGFHGNKNHIWADRVLSGQIVFGSPHLHYLAKEQVIHEYQTNSNVRSRIKKQLNSFISLAKTGTTSRSHNKIAHFNYDEGTVFFNPNEYIMGLKYPALRTVQQYLTRFELQNEITSSDPATSHKITNYIPDKNQAEILSESYNFALWTYHLQQYLYNNLEQNQLHVGNESLTIHLSNMLKILIGTDPNYLST